MCFAEWKAFHGSNKQLEIQLDEFSQPRNCHLVATLTRHNEGIRNGSIAVFYPLDHSAIRVPGADEQPDIEGQVQNTLRFLLDISLYFYNHRNSKVQTLRWR